MTSHAMSDEALDIIFRNARTQNKWQDKPVSNAHLMALYDLMRWGPTSANISPARIVFLTSQEAKDAAEAAAGDGNQEKTMTASAVAIIGMDLDFPENLPQLFPNNPKMKDVFAGNAELNIPSPSAIPAFRAAISSSPRARWAWIAGRCRASTMTAWTRNSSPAPTSNPISSAPSAMAIRRACFRAIRASLSTKRAKFFEMAGGRYRAGRLFGRRAGRRKNPRPSF